MHHLGAIDKVTTEEEEIRISGMGKCNRKIQFSERYFEMSFVSKRNVWLCLEYIFGREGVMNTQAP